MVDDMYEFVVKDERECIEVVKDMQENEKLLIDLQFGIVIFYDKLKDVKLKLVSLRKLKWKFLKQFFDCQFKFVFYINIFENQ